MKRVVIIGGGISGLSAAHRLIELTDASNLKITLLEASSRLGGIIQTGERDGFLVERGPDSFISEKPEAVSLAKRLGIESRLIETNSEFRRSFIVRNGRLRPVPEGFQLLAPSRILPFITTDIFSFSGKLRMAADLFIRRLKSEDESLASFVRRRLGQEALERMAQPMVGGIYTADPETLSLRATLPRFLEMEREHRSVILAMMRNAANGAVQSGTSGARYSLFLSFDRGVQVIVEALKKSIADRQLPTAHCRQVTVRLNTKVEQMARTERGKWAIQTSGRETIETDAVCLAVPSFISSRLIREADTHLSADLDQIKFASTATINLAFRRKDISHPLDGFGFVVPFVEKRSLLACTFSSVKFRERAPEGHVLLRAFVGGALQPDMFALDEEEMLAKVKNDLSELLGISGEPLFADVTKWQQSMPQYEVGHLDRMDRIENHLKYLPGLTLAGNSYRGAGIPDCIRSGERAAEKMINPL